MVEIVLKTLTEYKLDDNVIQLKDTRQESDKSKKLQFFRKMNWN